MNWATANGTAVGGEDFSVASGVLSIPAGATQGTITVLVSGDQVFEPKETFSVRLTAPRGASLGDAEGMGTILNDDLRPGTTDFRAFFDFGTPTSPVAAGYERVSQQTGYVADRGYGWQSGDIRSLSRSGWGALDTDLIYTPDGTFAVDLPVGTYSVDLILGDRGSYAHDSMGVYLEGTLMETVTTGSAQVLSRHYEVEVADGQLTLQLRNLGGRDENVCIEAMRIISAEAARSTVPAPCGRRCPSCRGPGSRSRCATQTASWCTPWNPSIRPQPRRSACCFRPTSRGTKCTRPSTCCPSRQVRDASMATDWSPCETSAYRISMTRSSWPRLFRTCRGTPITFPTAEFGRRRISAPSWSPSSNISIRPRKA